MEIEIFSAYTQDGLRLVMGRCRVDGGIPIILTHGLALNYRAWDIPYNDLSFAKFLWQRGYDVWLPCLRGHGCSLMQSDNFPKWDWNLDDMAIYDIPAIIAKVTEETQQQPFWIGHSMGGALIYMYLLGADYQNSPVGKKFLRLTGPQVAYDLYEKCALGNPNLARERNSIIRGVVTIGTPINMSWSQSPSLRKIFHADFWESNFVFPFFSKVRPVRNYIASERRIPVASVFNTIGSVNRIPILGKSMQKLIDIPIHKVAESYLCSLFWYPPNINKSIISYVLSSVVNDICGKVLDQFADWTVQRTFRAYPKGQRDPYIYSDHFENITVPLLMIAGQYDKIANSSVIKEQGFHCMGSSDKTFECFEKFGHNDLCMGINAPQVVFPFIENWIRKRL